MIASGLLAIAGSALSVSRTASIAEFLLLSVCVDITPTWHNRNVEKAQVAKTATRALRHLRKAQALSRRANRPFCRILSMTMLASGPSAVSGDVRSCAAGEGQ